MKLQIAQVVGLNTDQKAAQVVSSTREESTFLAVLGLTCDDAFTKGRQILSELEDFYFEFEGTASERLNATFGEAESKFSDGWDLCLAALWGKVLYIIGKGAIEVYLKRDDKLSPLLQAGSPSQLISGFVTAGDRLLFSTSSLVAFLGPELEKSLSLPIEIFEEEMGGKIGASDFESQGLAALALEVSLPAEEEAGSADEETQVIDRLSSSDTDQTDQQVNENYAPGKNPVKTILNRAADLFRRTGTYFPKSGRGRLAVAVVLIIIIVLGAGYKYKLSRDQEKQLQFNKILQEAKDDFESAKGLASLNPNGAKNKLDSAKGKINRALTLQPKNQEAEDLKKQIEGDAASILQQSNISEFPQFLDLDLIKKKFQATQMSLSGGKLLVLDPDAKTLAVVDLGKKSNQILAGSEQLGEAAYASVNGSSVFVYSKDKGVVKVDIASQKITSVARKDSDLDIKDIYGFAGNVYLLDNGQIWKYLPISGGYSDKREYLDKNTKADFTDALRMQIESSIYVLKKGGELLRFTKGEKDSFSYYGLDKGVKDPKSFFVSSDTDNLYLLDSGNSRLLVLTKTGSYKGQMAGSKFGTATDLVVDEKGKKVYLLEGSKIYMADLK